MSKKTELKRKEYWKRRQMGGIIDTVQCGDCLKLMPQLPEESVDLIVTDPPEMADPRWLAEAFRVLKTGRVCYVLSSEATAPQFISSMGQRLLVSTITWRHPNAPIYKWTPIFLLSKGEPEVGLPKTNIWDFEVVPTATRIIPAQKPIELMEYIILNSSRPGEIVLDPFLGVGTTAVACQRLNRHWIGMEILADRCKISRGRLTHWVGP